MAPSTTPSTPSSVRPSTSPAHSAHLSLPEMETPETRADRELEESMRSPQHEDQDDDELPAVLGVDPGETQPDTPRASPGLQASTLVHRNEAAAVKRQAAKLKLHPYQRDAAIELLKESVAGRDAMVYLSLCAVENKLDKIIVAMPKFAITEALQDNIDSYSMAVLLSSSLSAYKGSIPRDYVLNILIKNKLHLPDNVEKDQHTSNLLKTAAQDALTQQRSRIKKHIKESREGEKESIYDLAASVVSGTRCTVTVPLCARLALLRKMHAEHSGTKFWDKVDARLVKIRQKANNDMKKITRALADILEQDRRLYGTNASETASDSDENTWQKSLETIIGGGEAEGSGL